MKIALPLTNARWLYLVGFYERMSVKAPITEMPLASMVCAESYERYLKRFTWKPQKLTISVAEGMALHECLTEVQLLKTEPDPFIETIKYDLYNLIEDAFNTGSVPHVTQAVAPPQEGGAGTG